MTDTKSGADPHETGLATLPKELLYKIRAHVHNLETHVYFSQVCKATYKLYDEPLWKKVVMAAGWGIPQIPGKGKKSSWFGMAKAIVVNAERFKTYSQDIRSWVSDDVIFEADFEDEEATKPKPLKELSETGKGINIPREPFIHSDVEAPIATMFTVPDADSDAPFDEAPKLLKSPYIASRFLTIPAVSELYIEDDWSNSAETVRNVNGITRADALFSVATAVKRIPKRYWDTHDYMFFEGFSHNGRGYLYAVWSS